MSIPPGLLVSFYGDDFTGSTDSMEALARAGLRTLLFLDAPSAEQLRPFAGLRAVGVAGNSRSLSPEQMDAVLPFVFAQLRALNAPVCHLKICSTFDSSPQIGSIGHSIDIAQSVFASDLVPMVVGAPILNRFCVFGNLFARSGPESEVFRLDRHPTMSRHPVTPMRESDLRHHLALQTNRRIGLVDALDLARSEAEVTARIEAVRGAGAEILLFDTLANEHLAVIGDIVWQHALSRPPLFAAGSSGVEYALTACWRSRGWLPEPPAFHAEPVDRLIVVSGSCSPVTARQIEWSVEHGFAAVALDTAAIVNEGGGDEAVRDATEAGLAAWERGHSIVVHTCCGPDDPRLARAGASAHRSALLGKALGRILAELLAQTGIRRAVVAGGDTSGYVARELGIEALEVAAPIAPGSPLCRVYAPGRAVDGSEMLFKGGQVGSIDLFARIMTGAP